MRAFVVKAFTWITGKSEAQLQKEWTAHYFMTRSRLRAYWRVLVWR